MGVFVYKFLFSIGYPSEESAEKKVSIQAATDETLGVRDAKQCPCNNIACFTVISISSPLARKCSNLRLAMPLPNKHAHGLFRLTATYHQGPPKKKTVTTTCGEFIQTVDNFCWWHRWAWNRKGENMWKQHINLSKSLRMSTLSGSFLYPSYTYQPKYRCR